MPRQGCGVRLFCRRERAAAAWGGWQRGQQLAMACHDPRKSRGLCNRERWRCSSGACGARTWPHTSVFSSITPCVHASRSTGRLQGPRGVDRRSLRHRGRGKQRGRMQREGGTRALHTQQLAPDSALSAPGSACSAAWMSSSTPGKRAECEPGFSLHLAWYFLPLRSQCVRRPPHPPPLRPLTGSTRCSWQWQCAHSRPPAGEHGTGRAY